MAMHNPPHPGGIIRRQCLDTLDLSVTEAAKGLGVTRQALSYLINGKAGISTVEGIWFKSGDLARFANGVRSLAGACAHTFAKGSAFQSRLAINIALVR